MNLPRALHHQRQRLSSLVVILAGAGILAGPGISSAQASLQSTKHRSSGVQADTISVQRETPAPGSDLLLTKQGEQKADALAAFSAGVAAEEDADTEQALADYRKSLELNPGYTDLAVKVAFELARRGDVAQGIDVLKDAAKASPKEALPPLCLSQIYQKYLKKRDMAERYAKQALEIDPGNFACYLALYELYTDNGDSKKADAILERASKSQSQDPQFWLQLGDAYVRLSTKDDGNVSEDELKKITPIFQKALQYGKDDPKVVSKLADFYVLTKQVKEAIPLYLKVLEDPKSELSSDELLQIRDKLARSFLASGQRDEAIKVLEQIVHDSPTRYETYEMLGELYAVNNQIEKAIASYQQALLIDSTQPANYLRIADLQLHLKKAKDAVETLTEARAKFPGLAQVTYSLAIAQSQAQENTEAMASFAKAKAEAENSNEDLLNAQFYFSYGAAAEQAGELDKAAELLKKCIELDPSNAAQAYNYLGYMWVDKGVHLDEAGELIKRAVALDPENGAYLDSLGWYFYKAGKYPEAVAQLEKAITHTDPPDPVVFEHLGDSYSAAGRVADAVATWKKALALDPSNKKLTAKVDEAQKKLTAVPKP